MNLQDLLLEKRSSIVKKWLDVIIDHYPADSANFLKKQHNRFSNPVGHAISQVTEGLLDGLIRGIDLQQASSILHDVIKIKAVQDFSPSKALSFIFLLKHVIRTEIGEAGRARLHDELTCLENQIDNIALLSFDLYMQNRERIYEIKTDETRRMMFRLLQKANLICEIQDEEQDPQTKTVLTQNIKG